MVDSGDTLSRNVIVVNELGLHARAAAKIAELAREAKSCIWILKDGKSVDASGILDILTLECSKGCEITLLADHHHDIDILETIAKLIEGGCEE